MVKLLIKHGAAIAQDKVFNAVTYLLPPLSATEGDLRGFSDFILLHVPIACLDLQDNHNNIPLGYAVSRLPFVSCSPTREVCHPAAISILLAAGASLEVPGPLGATPLECIVLNRVDGPERFRRVIASIDSFQNFAGRNVYEILRNLIPNAADRLPFLRQIAPARNQRALMHLKLSLIREFLRYHEVWTVVAELYFRTAARRFQCEPELCSR